MYTTPFNYRIPETDDKDFWGSYNFDWIRMDAHRHDGLDSTKLNPYAIITTELTVPLGTWVADGTRFKNTITVPVAYDMPNWVAAARPPLAFHVVDNSGSPQANEVGSGTGQQIIVYSPFVPTADLYLLFG